ncbi:hypothetical protein GON04_14265 [Ramlibacter sp. MAH-25]|uniref:Cysteine-rich CWC family protein n=1 Tax=Ramlibacter pinisoli TaxID=2682844 RepID=A0A6N8IUM6_9BURK|nr:MULTISPECIES: cysteine-rich CWC family protein [Ramlibacter]MBA2965658.1 cysteine-rich CWC family protein [Ramlibacter sp. CGMCC 1.13660]MVQ30624.1 hypothetical protein [Ramlibacter pinisoli]
MPPDTDSPAPDAGRCPLCAGRNGCAMELQRLTGQVQPPCWCTGASFPPDLLDRIPAADRGRACICAACAAPTVP